MLKNSKLIYWLTIVLITVLPLTSIYSQTPKPKIGLVLSGGGAKGIAHVRALKVLPEKIAAAEVEIAALEASLSGDGLYAKNPKRFTDLSGKLATVRAQKDADEERWLTLEMAREALEP